MRLEDFANEIRRLLSPGVIAVTWRVTLIGFLESGPGFRANAGVVIAGEMTAGWR